MKILFGILFLVSAFGILFIASTPYLYRNSETKIKTWQEKLLVYRSAWVLIFVVMLVVAVGGWQNISNDNTAYGDSDGLAIVKNIYPAYTSSYEVLKVTSGNKADIKLSKGPTPVKLIGLDMFKDADDSQQNACYKKSAATKLGELLNGKRVELEGDDAMSDTKSDALLRYLVINNKNIDREMIALGFAKASNDPGYKYSDEFAAAEKQARSKELGLWSDTLCPATPKSTYQPASNSFIPAPVQHKSSIHSGSGNKSSGKSSHHSSRLPGRHSSSGSDGNNQDNDEDSCVIRLPILGCVL